MPEMWSKEITKQFQQASALSQMTALPIRDLNALTFRALKRATRFLPPHIARQITDNFDHIEVHESPDRFAWQVRIHFYCDAHYQIWVDQLSDGLSFEEVLVAEFTPKMLMDVKRRQFDNGYDPRRKNQNQNQKGAQQARAVQPHAGAERHGSTVARLRLLLQELVCRCRGKGPRKEADAASGEDDGKNSSRWGVRIRRRRGRVSSRF